MKLFTIAEMMAAEKSADSAGHAYATMMEMAGKAVADVISTRWGATSHYVLILVGPGNNGGDGLVAAHHLAEAGAIVTCYLLKPRAADDYNFGRIVRNPAITIQTATEDAGGQMLKASLTQTDIIIDALLGTGVARPIRGALAELLAQVKAGIAKRKTALADAFNRTTQSLAAPQPSTPPSVNIAAVDCPSGLNCDSGALDPMTLPADLTITFAGPKHGHFKFPGAGACGELLVADIGLDAALIAHLQINVATPATMAAIAPPRPRDGHKGTFGFVMVVGGSADYWGAPLLSALGAFRAGAGLVAAAVPEHIRPIIAGRLPEATLPAVPATDKLSAESARALVKQLARYDALLVGPGLGQQSADFLDTLLAADLPPLIVDADALNYLAQHEKWWTRLPANTILTPHPGEMARLVNRPIAADDRITLAQKSAEKWGHIVILKGAFTVIAAPDGRATIIPVANPALAVAGSGDVLAGAVLALRGQLSDAYDAARLGAYAHAMAARRSIDAKTEAILASEIADGLPFVLRK